MCPNCGYCPHCGRGGHFFYPYIPYTNPYRPYWDGYGPYITNGGNGGTVSFQQQMNNLLALKNQNTSNA